MTKAEEAEKDYIAGMKYREIAEKYGVSLDTVKSWKKRHGWIRPSKNKEEEEKKGVHPKSKKGAPKRRDSKSEKGTQGEEPEEVGAELKNQHKEFCVHFVKSYNATKAYQKVYGCSYYAAASSANKLLKNPKIRACIKELQEAKAARLMLTKDDVIQKYVDIAYADINDFAEIAKGRFVLKNGEDIDGTLVSSIKETQNGIEIKIPSVSDRMKAMGELQKLFEEQQTDGEEDYRPLGVYDELEGEE